MDKRCDTCKFWDDKHPRIRHAPTVAGIEKPGFCRKHKPGTYAVRNASGEAFAIGIQPIMDAAERCEEYRGKE